MSKTSKPDYEINQTEGTVTYWLDRDTARSETVKLDDMFELLFWLRRREDDIRHMVHAYAPVTVERLMTLENGFYVGLTKMREKVKVSAKRYQEVIALVETNARQKWLETQEFRQTLDNRLPVLQYKPMDNTGALMEHPTSREVWTLEDTPPYLIQAEVERLKDPQYWLTFRSGDNLDSGFAKLP